MAIGASSSPLTVSPGSAAVRTAHFAPFQVSTASCSDVPTATQRLAVAQDRASMVTPSPFVGTSGAAARFSEVPFQVKAYGR